MTELSNDLRTISNNAADVLVEQTVRILAYEEGAVADGARIDVLEDERDGARAEATSAGAEVVRLKARIAVLEGDTEEPPPPTTAQKILGHFADLAVREARLDIVGRQGIAGARIYGKSFATNGRTMSTQIQPAIDDGKTVLVSYKTEGLSPAQVAAGAADSAVTATRDYLNGLGSTVYACMYHEPYDDMTAPEFNAAQRRVVPRLKAANVKVGLILHGWLLDNGALRVERFEDWIDPEVFAELDWFGIDSYGTGTNAAPGPFTSGSRIPKLLDVVARKGRPDIPLIVGEFNDWRAATLAASMDTMIETPSLIGLWVYDKTLGPSLELEGDRLAAFKAQKSRVEVVQ